MKIFADYLEDGFNIVAVIGSIIFKLGDFLSKERKAKASELRRLVNLVGMEKRSEVVGAKVELCIKKAIRRVLEPRQTPSDWLRELIIERLKEEAYF